MNPKPWAILHCFPGHEQGTGLKVKHPDLELVSMLDASNEDRGLTSLATMAAPPEFILFILYLFIFSRKFRI